MYTCIYVFIHIIVHRTSYVNAKIVEYIKMSILSLSKTTSKEFTYYCKRYNAHEKSFLEQEETLSTCCFFFPIKFHLGINGKIPKGYKELTHEKPQPPYPHQSTF